MLAVIILTYNEEANLPSCLESLKRIEGHSFVVDSGSTDRTVKIAKAAGATAVEHPFENYGAQRNWALQNLPIAAEWVLHLDADERLTPELVCEINEVLRNPPVDIDGFLLRRRTVFMGKWIRHGGHYPSHHLRLFRKAKGCCEDRLYHQHFIVNGKVGRLKHDFIDVTMSDVNEWSMRHIRWAEFEALAIMNRVPQARLVRASWCGSPIERRRWLREGVYHRFPLFLRAFLYWFYRYFLRLGFLDGKEGLIFHFLQGCWAQFLVDVKIYEGSRPQGVAIEGMESKLISQSD